jgi:hypothetical protein
MVVVRQPGWKLAQHGFGVGHGDTPTESRFRVARTPQPCRCLWALQRGRAGHQPDVPGEAAVSGAR